MQFIPLFPLARLGYLLALLAIAVGGVSYLLLATSLPPAYSFICVSPLLAYLAGCQITANRLLRSAQGREREIVQSEFVLKAARRCSDFWGYTFAMVTGCAFLGAFAAWAYQLSVWFRKDAWSTMTWLSVGGPLPQVESNWLQSIFTWLANTNLGTCILILGLLLAAPIAAINTRANLVARRRYKEHVNLKKRS